MRTLAPLPSTTLEQEVLDWYRGEDAGDLKRSELNELVENLTCLNAFEEKNLTK